MKLGYILGLMLVSAVFSSVQAQERAAGGQLDTQVTWSAITGDIHGVDDKAKVVNARIDQVGLCAKKGMIYAPGATGADAQGCVMAAIPPSITNSINTLNSTVNATNSSITKIMTCNTNGQIYNSATGACSSIVQPGMVVKIAGSAQPISGNGKYASYALASCPSGTTLVDCAGARNPSITDTCDEEKCGFIGAGPINESTCMSTVDDDNGTRATVWAFCLKTN